MIIIRIRQKSKTKYSNFIIKNVVYVRLKSCFIAELLSGEANYNMWIGKAFKPTLPDRTAVYYFLQHAMTLVEHCFLFVFFFF